MGISKDDLMQNNPSHWRKAWPEGDTDPGANDEDVIDRLPTKKRSHKDGPAAISYPWVYDDDVIETGDSLALAEKVTSGSLTHNAVGTTHRGMDWANDIEFYHLSRPENPPAAEE